MRFGTIRRMERVLVCLALAAAPAFGAQGEGAYSLKLSGKAFDERCLKLAAGEAVHYRFSASAPVDFNIHYHRGKDVFYPVKHSGVREAKGTFRADAGDDYCLMWEHAGAGTATVEGTLERVPR